MATEQNTSTLNPETAVAVSAIENELPTYRAITPLAVFALVCGFGAICSFAHPFFYVFSILAIGLGIAAHRAVKRYPDMLTGGRLANAGIALGLVFGLVAGTVGSIQYFVRSRAATNFAHEYADVINRRSLGEMLWYNVAPAFRKEKTEADVLKEYEANRAKSAMMVDQKMGQMVALHKRVAASKEAKLRFVRMEGLGEDDSHGSLSVFALALFELEGAATKEKPEKEQYALAIFKGVSKGRHFEWWVEDVHFPYVPKTYVAPLKPVDDGHDHAH